MCISIMNVYALLFFSKATDTDEHPVPWVQSSSDEDLNFVLYIIKEFHRFQ